MAQNKISEEQTALDKSYLCELCGNSFTRKADANRHRLAKHASAEEKRSLFHYCKWEGCSYHAAQKSNLKTHLKTHTKDKDSRCPDCSYSTGDAASLCRHRKRIHGYKPAPRRKRNTRDIVNNIRAGSASASSPEGSSSYTSTNPSSQSTSPALTADLELAERSPSDTPALTFVSNNQTHIPHLNTNHMVHQPVPLRSLHTQSQDSLTLSAHSASAPTFYTGSSEWPHSAQQSPEQVRLPSIRDAFDLPRSRSESRPESRPSFGRDYRHLPYPAPSYNYQSSTTSSSHHRSSSDPATHNERAVVSERHTDTVDCSFEGGRSYSDVWGNSENEARMGSPPRPATPLTFDRTSMERYHTSSNSSASMSGPYNYEHESSVFGREDEDEVYTTRTSSSYFAYPESNYRYPLEDDPDFPAYTYPPPPREF
ncbi:hypothetical protein PM082_001927 [Marasmius tenuissimus]|nr:hypothetical protein PM082_001927 [Marasmius tenuissimus]